MLPRTQVIQLIRAHSSYTIHIESSHPTAVIIQWVGKIYKIQRNKPKRRECFRKRVF